MGVTVKPFSLKHFGTPDFDYRAEDARFLRVVQPGFYRVATAVQEVATRQSLVPLDWVSDHDGRGGKLACLCREALSPYQARLCHGAWALGDYARRAGYFLERDRDDRVWPLLAKAEGEMEALAALASRRRLALFPGGAADWVAQSEAVALLKALAIPRGGAWRLHRMGAGEVRRRMASM